MVDRTRCIVLSPIEILKNILNLYFQKITKSIITMAKNNLELKIIETLALKSNLKQIVYDNTQQAFRLLKTTIQLITENFNKELKDVKERVRPEFADKGIFVAQLRIAGDLLVFSMHSNIFSFDRNHKIWELPYLKEDSLNSYCGIINIYNFLDDSFRYKRMDDLGYLIARIFVNRNNHFFVEGKRQMGYHYKNFGKSIVSKTLLRSVIAKSIAYALEFDLLVPPYDNVKIASVAMLSEKMNISQPKTGKRLGFQFESDDVLEDKESA